MQIEMDTTMLATLLENVSIHGLVNQNGKHEQGMMEHCKAKDEGMIRKK